MSQPHADAQWARIDGLFDRALALPEAERDAFARRETADDPAARDALLALLARTGTRGDVFDRATGEGGVPGTPLPELEAGHRIGAYRVLGLLGRGGMGEVYRAGRADGQFEHQVAVKLLRQDAVEHLALFEGERRILATLAHPGIARLYDAGIDGDGRPYMVMELVEGMPVTHWCRTRGADLAQRLALFDAICDAVAFAHRHLVIHRDLKPANILVTAEGEVKLLDFGVARLLSVATDDGTRGTPLTLAYAAPEQLVGAAVSTATDVHALGVVLFELLCDRLPWAPGPTAVAVDNLLNTPAPAPSAIARVRDATPVPAARLAGDLDAIVAKALRKTPDDRYPTVAGLRADVQRHVQGAPVEARGGARLYVFGRFLRRYRVAVAATAAVFVLLVAGLAGTLWQAHRAERQAHLADATRTFMLGLFAARDPQAAGDGVRSELTVRQLLDAGVARIERDFRDEPDVQIELLGTASRIYNSLGAEPQLAAVQQRRAALARRTYGATHPIVIQQLINDANTAVVRLDHAKAEQLLSEADALIVQARLERSELRATWWQIRARLLKRDTAFRAERATALESARRLYAEVAPRRDGHATVLSMQAIDASEAGDPAAARALLEQAIAVATIATDRNDGHLAEYLFNLARADESAGRFDGAVAAYARAATRALHTYGREHSSWFMARVYHARLLHMRGDRTTAAVMFTEALAHVPPDDDRHNYGSWAREVHAERLAAEGRLAEALPLLEAALRRNVARPQYDYDVRESRRKLGDVLDGLGRTDEARALLVAARDEYVDREGPASRFTLVARERWARFLLDHAREGDGNADLALAAAEFRAVVDAAGPRSMLERARAQAGLARIALREGRHADAGRLGGQALATLGTVQSLYDVRVDAQLWRVQAAVLRANGDAAGALAFERRADAADRRHGAMPVAQASVAPPSARTRTPTPAHG